MGGAVALRQSNLQDRTYEKEATRIGASLVPAMLSQCLSYTAFLSSGEELLVLDCGAAVDSCYARLKKAGKYRKVTWRSNGRGNCLIVCLLLLLLGCVNNPHHEHHLEPSTCS
jgi:hypothetical protein